MNKTLVIIIAAYTLLLSSFVVPALSHGQGTQEGINSQVQRDVTSPQTGGVMEDSQDDTGFDWRWLLPLLAIPLLFLVFRSEDRQETRYRDRGQFAGSKGGRSERNTDN